MAIPPLESSDGRLRVAGDFRAESRSQEKGAHHQNSLWARVGPVGKRDRWGHGDDKDLQTGKSYSTYSQTDGTYHYSDLQPNHDYEIQAVYKGVASEVRQVSSFDTRMRLTVNLTIPPPVEK